MVGGLLVAAPVVVVEVVLAVAAVVIVPLQLGSTSVRYQLCRYLNISITLTRHTTDDKTTLTLILISLSGFIEHPLH